MSPKDRRKPLGGVDKETFVDSHINPQYNAELTYIMLSGIQSDLCHKLDHVVDSVASIQAQCECRKKQCEEEYDGRYVRRASSKYNVSLPEIFILAFLMGLGVLNVIPLLNL